MILSSTLRRCGAAVTAAALPLVTPLTASASVPGGNVYFNWQIPNAPAAGLTNITFPVTVNPATDHHDGIYVAQQFFFTGGLGGYIGLQPRADNGGQEKMHAAFSVFASTGGSGTYGNTSSTDPNCHPGADTGPGASCAVDFPAVYGHTYNLTIQQSGANTWTGTATDATVGGASVHIGTWTLLPSNGQAPGNLQAQSAGFIEYYLGVPNCAQTPVADAALGGPTTTDAGGQAGTVTMQNPAEQGTGCANQANYQSQAAGTGQHIVRGFTTTSTFTGARSGLCLTAPSTTWATQTDIEACTGAGSQSWTFTADSPASASSPSPTTPLAANGVIQGTLTLGETDGSGNILCLDDNAGTTAGTKATVWQCGSTNTHQQFALYLDGTIRSLDSGLCLDVYNGVTASGSPLDLWTCTGSDNQRWAR